MLGFEPGDTMLVIAGHEGRSKLMRSDRAVLFVSGRRKSDAASARGRAEELRFVVGSHNPAHNSLFFECSATDDVITGWVCRTGLEQLTAGALVWIREGRPVAVVEDASAAAIAALVSCTREALQLPVFFV
jgi:hypothetical protein